MLGAAGGSSIIDKGFGRFSDYVFQQTIQGVYSNNPKYMPWAYDKAGRKLFINLYKGLFYSLKTK